MARSETGLHIHVPGDGRGTERVVYVNGERVDNVFYADTKRGIVDYYPEPRKIHRHGKRMVSRRLRGEVRVEGALW